MAKPRANYETLVGAGVKISSIGPCHFGEKQEKGKTEKIPETQKVKGKGKYSEMVKYKQDSK